MNRFKHSYVGDVKLVIRWVHILKGLVQIIALGIPVWRDLRSKGENSSTGNRWTSR